MSQLATGSCRPVMNKPPPSKGLSIRILITSLIRGGFINHESALAVIEALRLLYVWDTAPKQEQLDNMCIPYLTLPYCNLLLGVYPICIW